MNTVESIDPQVIEQHDRPGPRYTSYPTALEFSEDYRPSDHRRQLQELGTADEPVALYVHLPFCQSRCSFCACHVVVGASKTLESRYLDAVLTEIGTAADLLGDRPRFTQLHWGGGTPTFHQPEELARLHRKLTARFQPVSDAEQAVEIDPRVTTRHHLELLSHLGFNRLSIGVQDVDDTVQELIGRGQSVQQTEATIDTARAVGFGSINLDLVYGLPGQTVSSFEHTMEAIVDLRPERLAVYSFAYVPWVKPHQKRIDPASLPARETKIEMLALMIQRLTAAGYLHIGMDHFALADDELGVASRAGRLGRNFMGYTTLRGTPVLGFGTSAISEIDGVYAQNHKRLSSYLSESLAGSLPIERGRRSTADDRVRRVVITELMCNGAVDLSAVGERFGFDPDVYFASEREEIIGPGGLADEGLAAPSWPHVTATPLGRLFVRRLAMVFDAYLSSEGSKPRYSRLV